MKWNLRMAAAKRDIWKASELQQRFAEHGLIISAGKMSGLWSGQPVSIKLVDLDDICAALGCGVEELLVPEPAKVQRRDDRHTQDEDVKAAGGTSRFRPQRPRNSRSLPPT